MKKFQALTDRLGYQFGNGRLLENALSHRSFGSENNERLEFLGDSILGLIIAEELYHHHPKAKEGDLSRMRASLVNGEVLAEIAQQLGVSEYLRLGVGERKSGGEKRRSILADAMEAIIGAIYLDSDLETCRAGIIRWYSEQGDDLANVTVIKDPKSQLQEWLQARKMPLPVYDAEISGEAHAQTFTVTCQVEGLSYLTTGVSTNRRRAEQLAAEHYLDLINE